MSVSRSASNRFVRYWRRVLAESLLGKGAFNAADKDKSIQAFVQADEFAWGYGILSADQVRQLFKEEKKQTLYVSVALRPYVYFSLTDTGIENHAFPATLTTVVALAKVARNGRIFPTGDVTVPRELLEPLQKSAYAVGTMRSFDAFVTNNQLRMIAPTVDIDQEGFYANWETFREYCKDLAKHVTPLMKSESKYYRKQKHWYVEPTNIDANIAVLKLIDFYDHIIEDNPPTPLLENFVRTSENETLEVVDAVHSFVARSGHSNSNYALAEAQRDALTQLLASNHSDVLTVNGPPGTGKTTLLLSVVASLWVNAALRQDSPPIIAAASSTNQAVSNIIDAFGSDYENGEGVFAGRWLPEVSSYGSYFCSESKLEKASKKYQTRLFFQHVESSNYFYEARSHFIAKAQKAFPQATPQNVDTYVAQLHQLLCSNRDRLHEIQQSYEAWQSCHNGLQHCLSETIAFDEPLQETRQRSANWKRYLSSWQRYQSEESLWFSAFGWLPPVKKKRLLKAQLFLEQLLPEGHVLPDFKDLTVIEKYLQDSSARATHSHETRRSLQAMISELDGVTDDTTALPTFAEIDDLCDRTVRFSQFRIATHYWEGRWLQTTEKIVADIDSYHNKKGKSIVEPRWYSRMMLTPCVVATFFKLPSLFETKYTNDDGASFLSDFLYNQIDLLIVDESGQVPPEIGGGGFSLAKRALVIGDRRQLEPIAQTKAALDAIAMAESGVIADLEEYERLDNANSTSANGSILGHAQLASKHHQVKQLDRGLYLFEHRRCYDNIIGYCNTLAYNGYLQPKRGECQDPKDLVAPTLGYAHVDGLCSSAGGGSRYNDGEAKAITRWIAENRQALEQKYGLPITQIVAVITPFKAQARVVEKLLRKADVFQTAEDQIMTVDTVHALQGSERPVVIFSAVYSIHADGGFIDRKPNMLNVAVSRAKDSFLLFGDMQVIEKAGQGTPRRVLYEWLLSNNAKELLLDPDVRIDLQSTSDVELLCEYEEHDAFLKGAFNVAKKEIHVVSPFITTSGITKSSIGRLAAQTRQKGVAVYIYVDSQMTMSISKHKTADEKRQEFDSYMNTLRNQGIQAIEVSRVHSKLIIVDRKIYCAGSFNWLSASRTARRDNQETSFVYKGDSLVKEIELRLQDLTDRAVSS